MADAKGGLGGFPWASAAVLVAFVASTQLVPHAFEPLRPAEKSHAQATPDLEPDVNARLWEDPFSALRRHNSERAERCELLRKQSAKGSDAGCVAGDADARDPGKMLAKLDRDRDQRLDDTLVVLGLLPGADFVGAEEARRRTRYAALAGLLAKGYVPDNAERLGLLEFNMAPSAAASQPAPDAAASAAAKAAAGVAAGASSAHAAAGAASQPQPARVPFVVPYELLSFRTNHRDKAGATTDSTHYAQIAVLWVDETSLPQRKLDSLARIAQQLTGAEALQLKAGGQPALAVIGPSSTDALRLALADLRCAADRSNAAAASAAAERCAVPGQPHGAELDPNVKEGYRLLSRAEFYNSASTASSRMLLELNKQDLDAYVTDQFNRITGDKRPVLLQRTVGNDSDLIRKLDGEIRLRLSPESRRRVVVVAERDSLYAQSLVAELKFRLAQGGKDKLPLDVEVVYFFRGLDGVTTRDGASAQPAPAKTAATLEWPESRDQLDYLRRLGASLKRSETETDQPPVGAIGIFANDVHDKLLVLQALHEDFSDRMFFTTDMDARFLHPRTQAFTRNLVVASSLPLAFYTPPEPDDDGKGKAKDKEEQVNLQDGTPPLRDIYQTSTYVAARRAGCRDDACKGHERKALDEALNNTSLYEIGRSNAVPLSGYALEARPPTGNAGRVLAAVLMIMLTGTLLLVWPSTPAIKQARRVFLREPTQANQPQMDMTAIVLVALHAGLFSYVLTSLIEFVLPSRLDFIHSMLLASLAAFVALLAVLPALLQARRDQPDPPEQPATVDRLHVVVLAMMAGVWLWLAWPAAGWHGAGVCSNCEPVAWLEGVSAWPSHLIHLLALFAILWTLDWAWACTLYQLRQDSAWLRLDLPEPRPILRSNLRDLARSWLAHVSVLFWRPGVGDSCSFAQLWKEYGERGEARSRAARVLVWFVLTLALVGLLFLGLSEGQIPEVPVRGEEHRQIVKATLYVILLMLPLLIVAVADAIVLLVRFVRHLNAGRTFYPDATIEMFAHGLGDEHFEQWTRRFKARPEERHVVGELDVHTLLDDWIDVQVVARRSAPVARLVIGPFVVLALLVVARSRLFDNWALTPAIAVAISVYVAALIALTLLLKQAAENTRRRALESMNADLRWLAGSGKPRADLVEPFKRLIAQVENNQQGAFAPFFEQPLLKAMLVPLGGAGGTQLFDYLLLGR